MGRASNHPGKVGRRVGDVAIDQTSLGLRVRGDFQNNAVLFVGGTLRYVF